ncbi:protein GRAVITROPIC IN THE LIGHT 1 [Impatiens glandulifera]|uniref:protein GRAVITROPIC IN THE LIGHT 1 n=1 Tax=Impatiens glandulifera TaxID=253017 RepID=UPI001FB06B2C|nr:protein GRAVITROPIC IN THE LIGHT 1 [Impatiens glandulifera]
MLPDILFRSFRSNSSSKQRNKMNVEIREMRNCELQLPSFSMPSTKIGVDCPVLPGANRKFVAPDLSFRSDNHSNRNPWIKTKKMASKVSNFSDLIQRVTASCLLHPLAGGRHDIDDFSDENPAEGEGSGDVDIYKSDEEFEDFEDELDGERNQSQRIRAWGAAAAEEGGGARGERLVELEMMIGDVFEVVSAMKRAYVSLQEAHCPWDPDKMRVADGAVVAELRRLGVFRERFRRGCGGGGRGRIRGPPGLRLKEVVAPYEAAVEELKREVKVKECEVENLKEKLKTATSLNGGGGGKKGRSHSSHQSKRKVHCSQAHVAVAATPELFESTMITVIEAAKSFTALLLSLMRTANWDIAAAVRSIEAATNNNNSGGSIFQDAPAVGAHYAKFALESYVNRKIFQGFDHETFYMDGSLSTLLQPDQYRRECFTQYRDMKAMDPTELLGILPTCQFGKFCSKKYLSIVHPKMEESLFGDLEQRRQVLAGNHPRSEFYGEFLVLAKAVWLLHLLAFSLDPPPSHFEATKGGDFHPQYMENVVKMSGGGRGTAGMMVGFPLSPGFKLCNGSVTKARVCLLPKA